MKNSPLRLLVFLVFAAPACQSAGQQDKPPATTSGGFHDRRKVPDEILRSLPVVADTILQTAHFQFLAHGELDSAQVSALARHGEEAAEKILHFTGWKQPLPLLSHHLYPTAEVKGLLLRNTERTHLDFEKNEAHTVLGEAYADNFSGRENEPLLRRILGKPATMPLERGLAVFFTNQWERDGWRRWSARLAAADCLPPLAELLDADAWEHSSHLVGGCFAASFVEFLMKKWGSEVFLKKYAAWQPSPEELADLEAGWRAFLFEKNQAPSLSPRLPSAAHRLPYLKGFNFAHEGYGIWNGYGSRTADSALAKMAGLGANAAAIVPYSFLRDPNAPAPLPVMRHPGGENDEAVAQSIFQAKSRGMTVVLKPQIWLGRGSWTGNVEMRSEEDWQAFFRHYGQWLAHYAMLAEIHGCEVLCVGTELVKTTLQRETDWRSLLRKVRHLYGGKLTYAANWGEEFEKTGLWKDLDFIGLDCYYPLSREDSPSDRELRRGFDRVLEKIEVVCARYRKPLVFTEIGFPSHPMPWKMPHDDPRGTPFNGEDQQRCYEAVFECLAGKPWCQGILWWKFPSHLDHRGAENAGFSPNGKPAEAVVKKWFGK